MHGGSMKALDENDQLIAGVLPADPEAGTKVIQLDPKRAREEARAAREAARKAEQERIRRENAPRVLSVKQLLETAEKHATNTEQIRTFTTGHYHLDRATGGIRPAMGWVFAAETNWGKSSWLISVADENIKAGAKVLIVSAEDDETIYGNRLLARRSGVKATRIRDRRVSSFDENKIREVVQRAEELPVFLDARGRTAEWIATNVAAMLDTTHDGKPIDVVAYDYLQEIPSERPEKDHRLTVKKVAGLLKKTVTMRKRSPIIFSQLTESNTGKAKSHPDRNQIRDCRDVANAAEVIVLGYTPTESVKDESGNIIIQANLKHVWLDKVKDGPKGFAIELDWDEETASFRRVNDPEMHKYDSLDFEHDPYQEQP
jgi:replicative DNA helicase